MKCQILFSRKNKKNIISLPSAKNAQRVVKVKLSEEFRRDSKTSLNSHGKRAISC